MGSVDEVKARVNIVDLLGRYLTLKPAGKDFKARCPFHPDDTPSLIVSPEKGLWHCFGCGAGGDAIGFLMRIERLTFPEALAKLAHEVGVELHSDSGKTGLFQVNMEAAQFFRRELLGKSGEKARAYLLSRGIGEKLWDRYGLGYAPPGWDGLLRALARFGVQTLSELGLVIKGERGPYDRFRDRVMFTIRDDQGRPVAFAGRSFEGDPKYLNIPNTALFTKGSILYGLDTAKEEIRRRGRAVVVEGYTDVISLQVAGIGEAVGSMGTALTETQARLLSRYTDCVVLAYDRDAAGEASSLRGMLILRGAGLRVQVASLPPGEDPDSFVRQEGREAVEAVLQQAHPFHSFFLESLAARYDLNTVEGKEGALNEARDLFPEVRSSPLRLELLHGLSQLLSLPPEEVQEHLKGAKRPVPREGEPLPLTAEDLVVKGLLEGRISEAKWEEIQVELHRFRPEYRDIVEKWGELRRQGRPPAAGELVSELPPEAAALASRLALVELGEAEEAFEEALTRFVRLPRLAERMQEVKEALREAEARGAGEEARRLDQEYQDLCRKRLALLRRR